MKNEIAAKNESQRLKSYSAPEIIVYGDVKKITLNTNNLGTTDHLGGEGPSACESPGPC